MEHDGRGEWRSSVDIAESAGHDARIREGRHRMTVDEALVGAADGSGWRSLRLDEVQPHHWRKVLPPS